LPYLLLKFSILAFIAILLGVIVGTFFGYPAFYFFPLISLPLSGFILSTLLAASVAIEVAFRLRTEYLLGSRQGEA
jgi:hypothetical protein